MLVDIAIRETLAGRTIGYVWAIGRRMPKPPSLPTCHDSRVAGSSDGLAIALVSLRSDTVAPFRLNHDELAHDLPWRLMQNGPVTLYWRQEYFEEDIRGLRERGFVVPSFDCREWTDEFALHDALRVGLGMPDYTGHNFDALNDSLSEIEVPEESGVMVALDNVTDAPRADVLLEVLADASRWWLLFGRIFGVLARTDSPDYEPPVVGAMRPDWNGREWLNSNRGK